MHTKIFDLGSQSVKIETGLIAKQTDASVIVDIEGTVILATLVAAKQDSDRDFFPLTVNYNEKTYAAGKIPGGFFKREGRPSEKETLISRLIDRPLRPLFDSSYTREVQLIVTLISYNPDIDPEIPALIASSAAVKISGLPFNGTLGAVKVGYDGENYLLNPRTPELNTSLLDLTVAGTENAVMMVESEAKELSEEIMLGAVKYGHEQMQTIIKAIDEFTADVGVDKLEWNPAKIDDAAYTDLKNKYKDKISEAYAITKKQDRNESLSKIKEEILENEINDEADNEADILSYFSKAQKSIVRDRIIAGEKRIDGRDSSTVRAIDVKIGVLPRTHGSALFTRGETQALVVTTLGTNKDAQMIDSLNGRIDEPFIFHYNFPPYSVGEIGFIGSPKRREIGHGKLARRGVQAVMPTLEEFPYTIRVVSEIMESNGSSSMASVCGSSLAMMDAGVPITAPVAGIAMGLVKENDKFVVLTDILGDEDHLGDMDFKVAGTEAGINALQMDIKVDGITSEIMSQALVQAKEARLHILAEMAKVISKPKDDMSQFAPRYTHIKVDPSKIAAVIGKGGAVIRSIVEATGAVIDINDDGVIKIAATDQTISDHAKSMIEEITAGPQVNKIYEGKVVKIMDFGAFVSITPNQDGLVHISQISQERVNNVSDVLSEGDVVKVKVLEVDKQGRVKLTMKDIEN
ncbi:MAG: polyribonucleotide nucleotidyltransferase [Gammaproteobacteria bacterium]|jgi:polyribonucleotide nucleotidyltransferase|nr:polyribonucleotide nucleotidyltransferase [Gammaproteobacteria bacterium]MBT4462969.1 polyribonucleotide nucleotidyltransferase [Gammaproteobacteria bacterium]MBT4654608.1 polyribonucleotide nucleotidyltransferase [Gammaproteobacteria bacterium]MBT5117081.1 polyribonucleotide nucleotidyltransferase [Gammaproteobacteria bacterium]MBT5761294.1 polyribonucleotide nucleotidyltransferase [Gammaproteobacteria bacterium]